MAIDQVVKTPKVLPRVTSNDVLKAAHSTFTQPIIRRATGGFAMLNPVSIGRQWAEQNPFTRGAMDFHANIKDNQRRRASNDNESSYSNSSRQSGINQPGAPVISHPSTPSFTPASNDNQVVRAVNENRKSTDTGFSGALTELRDMKNAVQLIVKNTAVISQEQKKSTTNLKLVYDAMTAQRIDQGQNAEKVLESRKNTGVESESGSTSKKGGIASLIGGLAGKAFNLVAGGILAGFSLFGSKITGLFKMLKLGEMGKFLEVAFAPFKAFIQVAARVLQPFAKGIEVLGRLGRLGRVIPVVGEFLIIFFTVLDGIKGFIKGWKNTDGNFIQKMLGGFKGAIKGIIDGILEPFIWLGKEIVKLVDKIADSLGIKKVIEVGKKAAGAVAGAVGGVVDTVKEAPSILGKAPVALSRSMMSGKAKENEASLLASAQASGITDKKELAMFMGQMSHESAGFSAMKERNYGADARRKKWHGSRGTQLKKSGVTFDQFMNADNNQFFEYMYSDKYRSGSAKLGNTADGDGARYRGRGFTQLTGKANYAEVGKAIGDDLVKNPELAEDPKIASKIALYFWKKRNVGEKARKGDVRGATQIINGGQNGLPDREQRYKYYLGELENPKGAIAGNVKTSPQAASLNKGSREVEQKKNNKPSSAGSTSVVSAPSTTTNNISVPGRGSNAPATYNRNGLDSPARH